ncbi:hypothetical protein UFOVP776_36 [uncultured Caudovirales phage]|uniref:Uncharacterized protein n=1 Tax=uncultured Caudovirales phage TaxID=2100421 RepID=A0A6J5NWW6_9CAUD|nr:hypothetical protein UFOVP776_36 [uncultured Caudovirales phage]
MKIKTTIHTYYNKYPWEDKGVFHLSSYKFDDTAYSVYVGNQEVEIDVFEDYDPRAQQIAALEKQKQKAIADYHKSVTDINEQISKLTALEYTA